MPTSSVQSYSAEVRTVPPRTMTFAAGTDAAAALVKARRWVEDQARDFLEKTSLPKNPWDAGIIFAADRETVAELDVYTSEGEYVFDWDDQD
ncbi:MAG TPA: hypothetical protein VGK85_02835 [Myxococcaceae bacterium]